MEEKRNKINNLQVNDIPERSSVQKEPIMEGELTGYPSIDKPWLKWYSECTLPQKIISENCFDYLIESTSDYSNNALLTYYGKIYKINDIKYEVEKNMRMFHSMGLKPGDSVSLIMIDVPEVQFLFLALSKMGIITNLIKFDETPDRINQMVDLTKSKYLFASGVPFILNNVESAVSKNKKIERVIVINPLNSSTVLSALRDTKKLLKSKSKNENYFKSILNFVQTNTQMSREVKDVIAGNEKFVDYIDWQKNNNKYFKCEYFPSKNDVCLIVYTGGTTGTAKGVELTNNNLIQSAIGFKYSNWGFDPGKTSLNILPPAIAYYFNSTYNMMCCGVNTTLIPSFDVDEYPHLLKIHRPNIFLSGPILLKLVAETEIVNDASFMTNPISGGDKLYVEEEKLFNDFVKAHGGKTIVQQGYGESECTAAATYSKLNSAKVGAIGIPMINMLVSIFDLDSERELKVGENNIGEIWISGPTLMKEYMNNLAATNEVLIEKNGKLWLRTGDLGYMDEEGRLYHKGRIKRMLTRSGSKVWLSLLEETIKSVISVKDCCCVKLNDNDEREVPVAHIVFYDDIDINQELDEIKKRIYENCPETYMPKYFVIKEKLPYTEVNKKMDYRSLEQENIFDDLTFEKKENIIFLKENKKILK